MYEFGLECLHTKRFDTEVPWTLVQILLDIDSELDTPGTIWRKPGVYDNLKLLCEGMEQEQSRADVVRHLSSRHWVRSMHAAFAVASGQYGDARRLLDQLGKDLDARVFGRLGLTYPQDAAKAYALSGEAGSLAARFQKFVDNGGLDQAETRRKALAALHDAVKKNSEEVARPYFAHWTTVLGWQEQFDRGEWVELSFDPLSPWRSNFGVWNVENNKTIVGTSANDLLSLSCKILFPGPLEVELDVEHLRIARVGCRDHPGRYGKKSMGAPCGPRGWTAVLYRRGTAHGGHGAPGGPPVLVNPACVGQVPPPFDSPVAGILRVHHRWTHLCTSGAARAVLDGQVSIGQVTWAAESGTIRFSNFRAAN